MKIRTQLIGSLFFFGLVLLIISLLAVTSNQQVDRLNKQEDLANGIGLKIGQLNYLTNDYILYHESQQADRWNTQFYSLSADVANLSVDQPEQQAMASGLKINLQRLKDVFDNASALPEGSSMAQSNGLGQTTLQVSWSRIAVQTQGIAFDASRLSQMIRDESEQQKLHNNLLIIALMGTFVAFLLIDYLIIFRGALRSIAKLREGMRIAGSGNLDHTIDGSRDNEIGELAMAFNNMTANLKTVSASKADLEKEIAERKRAENELRAAKQQAELYLDLLGHDINNMHTVALGYLELAVDNPDYERRMTFVEKPIEVLNRSANLVENVMKLQMLNEGHIGAEPVDVPAVLKDVQREFEGINGKKIRLNLIGIDHAYVQANNLLYDVFSNLVSNAIKHGGNTPIVDIIGEMIDMNGKPYSRVSVLDEGPGIPDDMKEAVFNRMTRGNTKAKGNGLGLYLVKSLVESYHGHVWVEDRVPGDYTQGSRFVVLLPATDE